jgi:hypothetical protein
LRGFFNHSGCLAQHLVFRETPAYLQRFLSRSQSLSPSLVFRVAHQQPPHAPKEIGPGDAELLLSHLPGQRRQWRPEPRWLHRLRRVASRSLPSPPFNEVPGMPLPPAGLDAPPILLAALRLEANPLSFTDPRIGRIAMPADHASPPLSRGAHAPRLRLRFVPPRLPPPIPTSPSHQVAHFCRADPAHS